MIRASNNPTECTPIRLAQSLGEFASLAALEAAHPTAAAGSYAVVNVTDGDDLVYYFSVADNAWFTHSGGSGTTPDYQAVTDVGNETTNIVKFVVDADNYIEIDTVNRSIKVYSEGVLYNEINPEGIVNYAFGNPDYFSSLTNGALFVGSLLSSDASIFDLNKIINNGNEYSLPTGPSSPIATFADIPTINEHYKGTYTSLSALETAHPTAALGNYAIVDAGVGNDAIQYIWDGQEGWVATGSSSITTTDSLTEGTTNLYFTLARVLATALTGLSLSDGSDVTSANSILVAIGKLQRQLTDVRAAKEDKRSYMSQSSTRFLDNTTALQKIFNVGSSGNGSIAVTSGRKYRVRGWAVFAALTSTSKNVSFGVLGTATASYVSGIGFGTISSAVSNPTLQALTSFSQTQIASNAAVSAGKIYIDFEFNCNGSGTFIPGVAFSAAQANMQVDSAYFDIVDIGASTANATSNIV